MSKEDLITSVLALGVALFVALHEAEFKLVFDMFKTIYRAITFQGIF